MSTSKNFFFFILLMSVGGMISSTQIFIIWMMFEVNTMAFLGMLIMSTGSKNYQCLIKYFLIQSIGGILFLSSALLSLFSKYFFWEFFITMSFLLKLGIPPLYFWVIPIYLNMDWDNILLLSTLQKLGPLIILKELEVISLELVYMISVLSLLIGIYGGINNNSLRLLMAYSTISHLGWMVLFLYSSTLMLVMYILFYMLVILPFFYNLFPLSNSCPSSLSFISMAPKTYFTLAMFNLAGVPPLPGFSLKFMIIFMMLPSISPMMVMISLMILTWNMIFYLYVIYPIFYFRDT